MPTTFIRATEAIFKGMDIPFRRLIIESYFLVDWWYKYSMSKDKRELGYKYDETTDIATRVVGGDGYTK